MTISGDTICSVIQAFPVLLIIAQNSNRCLKTPLIYKPPSPTHSPEFYEAYDALLQSLLGQGPGCGHEHGHQYPQYPPHHQYGENYKTYPASYGHDPCHGYPDYSTAHEHTHHGYPHYGHGYKVYTNAYPALKNSVYNISLGHRGYAPGNQVYHSNHKYKVVVKHNKIGKRLHSQKLKAGFQNFDQNERYASQTQRQSIFGFVPNTIRRLTGIIHVNQDNSAPKNNGDSYPSSNRPTELKPIDTQYNQYGRPIYNSYNQYPQQNTGFNQYLPNNNGFTQTENQSPPFNNDNFNNQNGFENAPNPITQLSPVNDGNTNHHYVLPSNQHRDDADHGNPNTNYDRPVWTDDADSGRWKIRTDKSRNQLEDKNGQVQEPAAEEVTTTTGPPLQALTPVATLSRSGINFANFQQTCDTVDGDVGSCIAINLCPEYKALLKSARSHPATLQLLRKAHCGFDGNSPKVCCPRAGIPSAPPTVSPLATTTTPAPPPTTPAPGQAGSEDVFLEPPVCGFSNASFGRVVGGDDAKLADFPWMALLGYRGRGSDAPGWLCGGSLVSAQHVLTAAHCVHNHETDLYVVRLGELDLARDDEGATPIDVPIRRKVKHQQYDPKAFTNDIALLVLERQVGFTDLIRPICMPRDSELRARNFVDYKPIIAGWGDTEFRGPSASHLQALQLPVVSNEFCASAYRRYQAQTIDERVLCAGYKKGGKDACQGDSGGPLMQPIWNPKTRITYFYQIGVVSFGRKCAEAGFPGVYSRVTAFIPWIETTLRETTTN